MSHVVRMKMNILDLDVLESAAKSIGLEMIRDRSNYKWFGTHVGDYPLPPGFTKEDIGKCDHVLKVVGANSSTYEVGVVRNKDGNPGYTLLWDFYANGHGLMSCIGEDGNRLKQAYSVDLAMKALYRQGRRVTKRVTESGAVVLEGI